MDIQKEYATLMEAYNAVYENQEQLDEAGLPYGPVGKGFRTIPAGRQREAMMKRSKKLRTDAMAASPEGDGGRGSSRGKMGEINSALLNPRLRPENRPAESVSYESDMFDIILEHLVAEGYADTNKAALAIMANMSEEWKQDIVEGVDMRAFKQQRSRQKQKEKRAADKIAPNRRAGIHHPSASPERAARHRANVDPDFEGNDERNYPGGNLNPKKVRKARALGELDKG